jgi:spermidine/putrescine-binding protein
VTTAVLARPNSTIGQHPSAQTGLGQLSIPIDWGIEGIAAQTDLIDPADLADPSWSMLLEEKYAGRISMPSITKEQIYWAAMVNGIDDYTNPTDDMLAQISETVRKLHSVVGYYYDNETELS